MLGEHVGDSPAHSTGRATSLGLRAAMAFFGHMGVEWNLLAVPRDQLDELGRWIDFYKQWRHMLHTGHVVHGDAPDPAVRLDGVVSADGSQALYRFTQLTSSVNYPPQSLVLPGLDSKSDYRIRPLDICSDLDLSLIHI